MRIALIDNYDSFVYNILQMIKSVANVDIEVYRNDEIDPEKLANRDPDAIIISPGPGNPANPDDVGYSIDIVKVFYRIKPILGVCLGHQIIGYVFGSGIRRASRIYHGKTSLIKHFNGPLYRYVPRVFRAMRYHSLVIHNPPRDLVVDAVSLDDGEIMGVHHYRYPVYGVQYHPESIGTDLGKRILKTFIEIAKR